jgi:probable phosphoglycerate mutase
MQAMTTWVGLIRHAKTPWNLAKRIQGQNETRLAPEGEAQAQRWVEVLQSHAWDRIVHSQADRARQTAEIINTDWKLPLESDARLLEQDWGLWTGRTIKQLKRESAQELAAQDQAGWGFCPPGGEDRLTVWRRAKVALDATVTRYPGQRILVISHQSTIRCILYRLLKMKFSFTEPEFVKPYALHWLRHDHQGWYVQAYNAVELD